MREQRSLFDRNLLTDFTWQFEYEPCAETDFFCCPRHYLHNLDMAPGGLLDHDTKVYLFKQYRQFWAAGPAAAVAVIAGVRENIFCKSSADLF